MSGSLSTSTSGASVDLKNIRAAVHLGFPLKFTSQAQEINFYSVLDVLNFGSGFRDLLHKHVRRGAFDTIAFGCMAMHLSGLTLNADFLCGVSLMDVQSYFGIPIDEEFEISKGIRSTRPSALRPLAAGIKKVLNECGVILRSRQFADFAEFIFDTPQASRIKVVETAPPKPLSAADVVYRLVTAFPAFADVYTPETAASAAASSAAASLPPSSSTAPADVSATDNRVYIYKKAQLLVCDLHLRFGRADPTDDFLDDTKKPTAVDSKDGKDAKSVPAATAITKAKAAPTASKVLDPRFQFPDLNRLTAFTDNVLPAVLRYYGVLKYSPALASIIDEKKLLKDQKLEAEVRAAAIVACEQIVERINATRITTAAEAATAAAAAPAAASATAAAIATSGSEASAAAAKPAAPAKVVMAPFTAAELDYYLWQAGKFEAIRKLPRHYSQHTIYY